MAVVLGTKCLLECDLIVVSGASEHFRFEWTKELDDGTVVPAELDGSTALCHVRLVNDGEIVSDLSEFVSFDGSFVILDIPSWATAKIDGGRYLYDMMITEPGGSTTRFVAGKITVVDPISEVE